MRRTSGRARYLLPLILGAMSSAALAAGSPWRGSAELWGYGTYTDVRDEAPLNPDNRVAQIPDSRYVADLRADLRGDFDRVHLYFAPRWVGEQQHLAGLDEQSESHLRLRQGFVRVDDGSNSWLIGRERLTWGPANFRSPSNPYYFDSGRVDPLASTHGIDLVRMTHGMGEWRLTGAHVRGTREVPSAGPSRRSSLLKLDHQGEAHLVSGIVMWPGASDAWSHRTLFLGAFGQHVVDDAWLLYWELGSGASSGALALSDPPRQTASASRRSVVLVGGSYTRLDGHVVYLEYLHDEGGFDDNERQRYWQLVNGAADRLGRGDGAGAQTLGVLLGGAPRLLGRHYVWAGWQSNPQETRHLWRAELTLNLDDGSARAMLYGEKSLTDTLSGFAGLTWHTGSYDTDFGMLARAQLSVGLKWFAF